MKHKDICARCMKVFQDYSLEIDKSYVEKSRIKEAIEDCRECGDFDIDRFQWLLGLD